MALTLTSVKGTEGELGRVRQRTVDVLFDSSYPTGGEVVTPHDVGLGTQIFGAQVIGQRGTGGANTANYLVLWDYIAQKLQVFASGDAAGDPFVEEANATDLSTFIWRITFTGV